MPPGAPTDKSSIGKALMGTEKPKRPADPSMVAKEEDTNVDMLNIELAPQQESQHGVEVENQAHRVPTPPHGISKHDSELSCEPLNDAAMDDDPEDEGENYEDKGDADYDPEKHKIEQSNKARKSVPLPKGPHEWFKREWERDQREAQSKKSKSAKKRKPESDKGARPAKAQKSSHDGSSASGSVPDDDAEASDDESQYMPEITSKTKQAQWKIISAHVPKGSDSRRSSEQRNDLDQAHKCFGFGKVVTGEKGTWRLKNMATGLWSCQITAAAWMMKQECYPGALKGGLIADEMGMGKTLVSLACISGNPPEGHPSLKSVKSTLIILPSVDVVKQWEEQLVKHCGLPINDSYSIYAQSKRVSVDMLTDKHIIFTTYQQIQNQYPSIEEIKAAKNNSKDPRTFKRKMQSMLGPLFKVDFYRIILDEAHKIKNHKSRTSLACVSLRAEYRWAVTGTPLSNDPMEFFPYLRFLGAKFSSSSKQFREKYIKGIKANAKFDALVSMVMYRRTKNDKFLGKKILKLPDCECEDIIIPLSREEGIIHQFIDDFYGDVSKGAEGQNGQAIKNEDGEEEAQDQDEEKFSRYNKVIHLRQAVSHPFNLERFFRAQLKPWNMDSLIASLDGLPKQSMIEQLKKQEDPRCMGILKFETGWEMFEKFKQPVFGGRFDMQKLLKLMKIEIQLYGQPCASCEKTPPREPCLAASCPHVQCMKCAMEALQAAMQSNAKILVCPHKGCNEQWSSAEDDAVPLSSIFETAHSDKKYQEPGMDSNKVKIAIKPSVNSFVTACNVERLDIAPSSKLMAAMVVILDWQTNFPEDKVIVFTEWVMTGKILGHMLRIANIGFLYYYGSMSDQAKETALRDFRMDPKKKILVAGLRCGSESLDLIAANRVILIDLWWNNVAEKQAFGRVHRLNQEKTCYLVRIITESGTDGSIDELQVGKAEVVDRALQDDEHIPEELNNEELKEIFGQDSDERDDS